MKMLPIGLAQCWELTGDDGRQCFSEHRLRVSRGLLLGLLVALAWAAGSHLLRALHLDYVLALAANERLVNLSAGVQPFPLYEAPFFTTCLLSALNAFFFPVYLASRFCAQASFKKELADSVVHTFGSALIFRCCLFAVLWTLATYMLVQSISLLDATDVVALYTTNVAFVYLLSWVLLQEQFVGIRIVAVILCNTGIALFAYMDGGSRTHTLAGVVLAAASAAGTAVYKVLFKKVVGAVTLGQLSFFLSLVGVSSVLLSWPFFLAFYFAGYEKIDWSEVPWLPLVGAALFILLANMLGNFGVMWTYEVFLKLGLLLAIPSSLVVDVYLYSVVFQGMKLAGVILSMIGFCLVLMPDNWPDYITRKVFWQKNVAQESRLRTQSGRVK